MEIESEKCKFKFCVQIFALLFLHIMTKCRRKPVAFVYIESVINILLYRFVHNLANQSYNHAELSLVWNKTAENVAQKATSTSWRKSLLVWDKYGQKQPVI